MSYNTDTLTNANRNREASRKFFQQQQQIEQNQQHQQQQQQQPTTIGRTNNINNISGAFAFSQINLVPTSSAPLPVAIMLHRSPSGAKRKIRQRREEITQLRSTSTTTSTNNQPPQQQQQNLPYQQFGSTQSMTSSSSLTNNETTYIDLEYRTLVDSSSYRSILDDNNLAARAATNHHRSDILGKNISSNNIEDYSTTTSSPVSSPPATIAATTIPNNRIVTINTFAKPEPPRRTLGSIDDTKNIISKNTDKYTYPPYDNLNGQIIYPGKPTIEVHPMPAPRHNNSFNNTSSSLLSKNNNIIIPPPIPKKPERLKKMSNSSITSSLGNNKYSDEIMSASSVSPNENEFPNDSRNNIDAAETSSDTSFFDTKPNNNIHQQQSPQCYSLPCSSSIEALDKLHTSPLVRSIEEKFDDVRASVIECDSNELTELEKRLISTINKLTKKVNERTSDLDSINNEKEAAIGTIKSLLISSSPNSNSNSNSNSQIFQKIEKEIRMRAHLIQLEGIARVRLQQIASLGKDQANALHSRSNYWHEKIKDIRYLAVFVSQRINEIEDEIYTILDSDDFATYKKCMDLLIELEAENTETSEKLSTVQKQIDQLQNISTSSTPNSPQNNSGNNKNNKHEFDDD